MITENLSTLKINKLTQEQYNRELEAGNIDETALYLTPDEEIDLSGYAIKEEVEELLSDKVPTSRTINGKALSEDISLSASDIGAVTSTEIDNKLSNKANSSHQHSASNITTGTLSSDRLPTIPIEKGGTGATSVAAARTNLGLVNTLESTCTITNGSGTAPYLSPDTFYFVILQTDTSCYNGVFFSGGSGEKEASLGQNSSLKIYSGSIITYINGTQAGSGTMKFYKLGSVS